MALKVSPEDHKISLIASLCHDNFAIFVKRFWQFIPPGHKLQWNWHLDAICHELTRLTNGEIRLLVINMPPGFAKTALVTILYPAWRMLRDPKYSVICGTHTQTFAEDSSRKTRMVVESPLYRSLVQALHIDRGLPLWEMAGDQNAKREFVTSVGGKRQSIGRDTAVMGSRADEVIIDDPIDIQNIDSPTEVVQATDWVINRMRTRVNNPKTAKRILVMQRLSMEDPSEAALAEGWDHLKLSMEFDSEDPANHKLDPRKAKGELLFPERFTEAELLAFQRDPRYQEQFNQNVTKDSDRIFDIDHFQYYDDYEWVRANVQGVIISVDPSGVGKEQSKAKNRTKGPDYFVAQVWGRIGADRYLLHQVRGQWGLVDQLERLREILDDYPAGDCVKEIIVEQAATGSAIEDMLSRELAIPVIAKPPGRGPKPSRAKAILPPLKDGHIFIPRNAPWLAGFLDECHRFPNGKNDDQVDTLVIGVLHLQMSPEDYEGWLFWGGGRELLEKRRKLRVG